MHRLQAPVGPQFMAGVKERVDVPGGDVKLPGLPLCRLPFCSLRRSTSSKPAVGLGRRMGEVGFAVLGPGHRTRSNGGGCAKAWSL